MKVDIFCAGKFHFHKYIKFLADKEIKLIFSHKRQTLENVDNVLNLYLKEYSLYFLLKILPSKYQVYAFHISHFIWNASCSVYMKFRRVPEIDHFLCHGNSSFLFNPNNKTFKLAQVVNAHPAVQSRLLEECRDSIAESYRPEKMQNPYFSDYSHRIVEESMRADFILAPSTFVRDSYVENGFDPEKIYLINYGLDEVLPSSELSYPPILSKRRGTDVRILCVGLIIPRKGQHTLLAAVEKLRARGYSISVTLVGGKDQNYGAYLDDQFASFDHVEHIENSRMREFMSEYDLFVLPSFEDGFAVVVGEAISAGLPVLVSDTTGSKDLFSQGDVAVFEHGNIGDLSSKIEFVMLEGYNVSLKYNYNWRKFSEKLYDVYSDILRRGVS